MRQLGWVNMPIWLCDFGWVQYGPHCRARCCMVSVSSHSNHPLYQTFTHALAFNRLHFLTIFIRSRGFSALSPVACTDVEPICTPPTSPERDACYASGCCCYGATCTDGTSCCNGAERASKRAAYGCPGADTPIALPSTGLVGFSIFDLDTGASGEYTEVSTCQPSAISKHNHHSRTWTTTLVCVLPVPLRAMSAFTPSLRCSLSLTLTNSERRRERLRLLCHAASAGLRQ